ncbi:MAG: VTT domain-containing protein [Proteobacteria bacterium]|nr:VTT domain-containing protein [Pseudomonadota bacterium]
MAYAALLMLFIGIAIVFKDFFISLYLFLSDKEQIKVFITNNKRAAPLVFILIQILQVIFAPVPGEATGFIGGYIFGTTLGFLYSSVGLLTGSCLNFFIGRIIGVTVIRKLVSEKTITSYDRFFKKQGIITLFLLFVIPGFPKDILSYLAGISMIPFKFFFLVACFGRMPGTLALSLQGEFLFQGQYGIFAVIFGLFLILAGLSYIFRERIYNWLEGEK